MKKLIFTFILCFLALNMFAQNTAKWQTIIDTEQTADNLVENRKTEWGLNEKDALVRSETMPKTDKLGYKRFAYQQKHNGVKVEGAVWLIHEKDGLAKTANGNLVKNLNVATTASLSEEQALQYALNSVNAEVWAWEDDNFSAMAENEAGFYPQGELVLVSADMEKGNASAESYVLAYKFDVFAVSPMARKYVYVNAQNGNIVTSLNRIQDADVAAIGTASYSCNNPVDITATFAGTQHILRETERGQGIETYDTQDDPFYVATDIGSADNNFDEDAVAVAAHYGTEQFYDYLLNVHERNSIDDNGFKLKSWVHFNLVEYGYLDNDNAFWNGSFMTYGDGQNVFSPLTCLDVIGHEISHGLTEFTANLIYSYESGALNEAFSDIFGTLLEFYAEPECADWILGEDITIVPGKNGLRNMQNPNDGSMITQQPDTYLGDFWYTGNGDNGGVHYNSGVLNYWFYLIANGGSGANDNGNTYNVAALDADLNEARAKAADIAFRTLTVYLTPLAQYIDAKNASIQAAEDLYGENSNEVNIVRDAWCAVGVGSCLQNDNGLTISTPNGGETWQGGSNKVVTWGSTGNIAQIDVVLSINGGASWQSVVTATNNDGAYGFVVPNVATTQALVKVSDSNDGTVYDVSDAVFTIEACNATSGFENTINETCVSQSLDFMNTAVNATAYEWFVNGEQESNTINFNYTFAQAGTYLVSLVATNGLNCTDEYNETITVYPIADANFSYTKTDLEIQLFATNEAATTYEWTADNMSIGNTANLTSTFADEGTYDICLSVNDDCGTDTFCENIIVSLSNPCESGGDTWRQYLNGDHVNELLEVGDNIYVGTNGGGLVKINQVTGETTFFNSANSDLPHNYISSLLKSSSGEVFIGTDRGLAKFDGTSNNGWAIFNTNNSDLPHNYISSFLESSSGEVFIGTGEGLAKFDGTSNTGWTIFNTDNSDLPVNSIYSLLESSNGDVFVGTASGGLAKFDGTSSTGWTIFNTANSDLPNNDVSCLLENSNGEIFVGTWGGGLVKFDGASSTDWTLFNLFSDNTISSLLESSSGEIFVGMVGSAVVKFDDSSGTSWTFFHLFNSDLPNNGIRSLLENSSGEVFVGTEGGLVQFDGTSHTDWTFFNTSNSDWKDSRIRSLLASSSGDIFIGSDWEKGLAKFDGSSNTGWTIFNTDNSDLPANGIYSLLESSNGDIFVGTVYGGLAKFDGSSSTGWTIFNTDNSDLPGNNIISLLESSSGEIFVGTLDGLAKFDGSSSTGWTIFNTDNSDLPNNNVYFLLESNSGEFFITTDEGGLAKFDGSSSTGWTIFNTDNSDLPSNSTYLLLESSNSEIFVSTTEGLAKFDGSSSTGWTIFNTDNSDLPNHSMSSLLESSNGEFFITTYEGGLAKFDGSSSTGWTIFNTDNSGLSNNTSWSFLVESNNEIFIGTLMGLSVLSQNSTNITASFNTPTTPICTNESTTFTNTSLDAETYEWYINGNQINTTLNLNHIFAQAGEYTINLKTYDSNGCEDTYSENITINHNASQLDLGEDILLCDASSIILDAGFEGMQGYVWALNDIVIASTQSITATESGTYLLTILDQCGNADFDEIEVEIGGTCVWPGDTNYDNIVNAWDILPLGLGYGTIDTARPNASLNWEAQACQDWPQEQEYGINYKHIDTNGDGIIDGNDTQAITTNANLTHGISPIVAGNNSNSVSIVPTLMGAATLTSNNLMVIDLNLSEDDTQNLTAYGLAFRVTYYLPPNVASLQNAFVNFNGSWLGEPNELLTVWKHFPEENIIEIGMTRFNLQNKIGQGKIVQLILEVDIDDVTTIDQMDVYLEIEGVELVLNNNTAIPVGISNNTITLYRNDIDAVVENEHIFSQINLYPNPAKDNLNINFTSFSAENINIKVIDILGKTILIKDFETQQGENNFTLNVKDLPSGTYFLEIENGFENTVQKFMVW